MFKIGQKTSFKTHRKRNIAILVIVALLIGGGAYALYRHNHPTNVKTPDGKTVKLKPATKEEVKQADDNKTAVVKRNEQDKQATTNGTSQTPSTVIITSATSTEVRGYVSGVFEEGGTCTATATMGGQTVTKSVAGFQNVSNTQCTPIKWDSPLSSGSWNVTLSYKSATTSSTQSTTIGVN